jgi:methionyl-tRNA formyltransferase
MRIVFMGTPAFAVPSLEACLALGEVVLVVTQPDKPSGRGQSLTAPPVKVRALERGLPVAQPPKLRNTGFAEVLRSVEPDVCVVTAYGKILPLDVLEAPRRGSVNVHASLLPRWRGAAPIQRAIEAGDAETGVCLMQMDEGLDTGAVISCARTPIGPDDTSASLHQRLSELGGALLVQDLPRYVAGQLQAAPQPADGVTLAKMIDKEEGLLDFRRPAAELERRLRAFTPWPGAFTHLAEPGGGRTLLKVHRAQVVPGAPGASPGTLVEASPAGIVIACAQGALSLVEVQAEGKKRVTAAEFVSGRKLERGTSPFVVPSGGA